MKKLLLLFALLLPHLFVEAAYTLKNGKLVNSQFVASMSVQEHYSAVHEAYQQKQWEEVVHQALIVIKNFPATPFAEEVYFHLGVGYFHLKEFELANSNLTKYLKKQASPKFFEEAIQFKFDIAEQFHHGAKKHVLGWESMPKWMPATEEAIAIYDEVITALPHHELAAQSLFGKANLLLIDEEYKASVETFQTLIRRFPKHPLAIESYIGVSRVYLIQSKDQYPDQDYLDLSEINVKKFKFSFPGEQRIAEADLMLQEMKEVFASNLYDTGRFYERTKKPHAAYIYYTRILAKYPLTKVAQVANKRLDKLNYKPEGQEQKKTDAVQEPEKSPLLTLPVKGLLVESDEGKQ